MDLIILGMIGILKIVRNLVFPKEDAAVMRCKHVSTVFILAHYPKYEHNQDISLLNAPIVSLKMKFFEKAQSLDTTQQKTSGICKYLIYVSFFGFPFTTKASYKICSSNCRRKQNQTREGHLLYCHQGKLWLLFCLLCWIRQSNVVPGQQCLMHYARGCLRKQLA